MTTLLRNFAKKALGVRSWNSDDDQKRLIPGAKTIFDVGANIGQTAKTYRRLFPQAEIWSFEPFPGSFNSLCRSISGDGFHAQPVALSDQIATTALNIGAVSITNSLLRRDSDTGRTIEIRTDTIDHFCSDHDISNIDILKVDVEGAEDRVFRGAEGLFSRQAIRSVFVEVYFRAAYEGMPLFWDLHSQLTQYGFGLHALYSLIPTGNGALSFGNALYLQETSMRRSTAWEVHTNEFVDSIAV
jgi:FkbM family methyltransferase